MPLIEGFGDEVTYAMMVLIAIFVITACWLSTQLRFIPFVNVFVLESMQDLIVTNVRPANLTVHLNPEMSPETFETPEEAPQAPEEAPSEDVGAEAPKNDTPATASTSSEDVVQEDADKVSEEELVTASSEGSDSSSASDAQGATESGPSNASQEPSGQSSSQEQQKKKEKQVKIRLMYLNNTQRTVEAHLSDTIGEFRRSHFQKELSENKMVRFIFNGKALGNDTSSLSCCNVKGNSIIHCLITPSLARRTDETTSSQSSTPTPAPANEGRPESSLEMVLYPSLIILFAVIWYQQFTFDSSLIYSRMMPILGVVFFLLAMFLAFFRAIRLRAAQHV